MAEQYTSIRLILDKLLRHPLMQDISLETAVDYTVDFMRIVGVPKMFFEKTEVLKVNNYRALLPCDYYHTIQIRDSEGNAMRYSTDTFHMSQDGSIDNTYKIQGNVIFTSFEKGCIEISYLSIPVDEDGFPLIPDNSSFTRALEAYVKKQWFTILFDIGRIKAPVLQNIQQEYAWAVGDCQSEFNRMTIDQAESFYNSWRTLILRDTQHRKGFKYDGVKEYLKQH